MDYSNFKIPDEDFQMTSKIVFRAKDYLGHFLVMFFYPRDNTPGCTDENTDFSNLLEKFNEINTKIFGISRETVRKHENFKKKFDFKHELIADVDEVLCKHFNLLKEKMMWGKKYIGIERTTFIFDTHGNLIKSFCAVKVPNHANEVLEYIKNL